MGDSAVVYLWTFIPALVSIGLAVLFIILAVRLVRAVERIADKLG
jgi:Ca2+/H+ antiporter